MQTSEPAWENVTIQRLYLHHIGGELSDLWSYDAPQQEVYHYLCYEVYLDIEVDLDTGHARAWGFNGQPLLDPVRVT